MIVAIDGPAGVGKSTIAKKIAKKCNFFYINSGNFYRAVAFKHLAYNGDPKSEAEIVETARSCNFLIIEGKLFLDGKMVEHLLRNKEIDMASSKFSSIVEVRNIVNEALRSSAKSLDIIMEGRDITTVVFPQADLKFYFDASVDIRAARRFQQNESDLSLQDLKEEIIKRDYNDRNKKFGALKRANDAVYIDTSYLTIDEVCDKVVQNILGLKQSKVSGES
ncbi:(d)CMP kinase [archaeon]|nr:(d)CMP kinase [archaeon]MBL7007160.1 (d)CMP kinase [Spirochaetia bacterium]